MSPDMMPAALYDAVSFLLVNWGLVSIAGGLLAVLAALSPSERVRSAVREWMGLAKQGALVKAQRRRRGAAAPFRRYPGMRNVGNTCYLNSVMQALSSCIVREDFEPLAEPGGGLGVFGRSVLAILDALNTPNHPLVDAATMFSTPNHYGSLLNAQQQDAHELCQVLLSTLASNQRKVVLKLSMRMPLSKGVQLSGIHPRSSFALPQPSILLPWEGLQASTVTCVSCGRGSSSSMQVTPFSILTLPSMSESTGASIEDAFDECMAGVTIDDYACDNCKARVTCVKRVMIVRWPQLLILHINRLAVLGNFGVAKSEAHISFPQRMFAFCQGSQRGGSALSPSAIPFLPSRHSYELAAVVEHHGGSRGGHYTAFKRVVEEDQRCRWLLCSDSSVRPVTLERVLEAKAYLICYRRMVTTASRCLAGHPPGPTARR